jgi:hypothetical protein
MPDGEVGYNGIAATRCQDTTATCCDVQEHYINIIVAKSLRIINLTLPLSIAARPREDNPIRVWHETAKVVLNPKGALLVSLCSAQGNGFDQKLAGALADLRRCHAVGRCKALFATIPHALKRLDGVSFSVA